MKTELLGTVLAVLLVGGLTAIASIPEPDVVLYGPVYFDQVLQTQSDTGVSIIARVDGLSGPVGTYAMGDNEDAGNDFVLRIRLVRNSHEIVPSGSGTIL